MVNLNKIENIEGTTINKNIKISALVDNNDIFPYYETFIKDVIFFVSTVYDASCLEGITFSSASCYEQALNNIKRGFELSNPIIPSDGSKGMTLALKRNDLLRAHIVFNIDDWEIKENLDGEYYIDSAITSAIAHEIAHVEIMERLHEFQPNICLEASIDGKENYTWKPCKTCIEEYIACRMTSPIDDNNTLLHSYEIYLMESIPLIRTRQDKLKEKYINCEIGHFEYMESSYKIYSTLFLHCSYYLGSNPEKNFPQEIKNSFFYPYLEKIILLLEETYSNIRKWKEHHPFKKLQFLLEEITSKEAEITWIRKDDGLDYYNVELKRRLFGLL